MVLNTDKLCEQLQEETCRLSFHGTEERQNQLGKKIIAEGIGVYFGRTMNNGKDEFSDQELPPIDKWTLTTIYEGGHHLVKPIIDRYGKEGIAFLITHPPTHDELEDIPTYQQYLLKECAKLDKSL